MSALISDILDRAADLIEPEGAWTRVVPARAGSGEMVLPYSKRAICWCLEGAIASVIRAQWWSRRFEQHPATLFLQELGIGWGWNDVIGRTQTEVVAKLREAAALAREQGK